MLYLKFPNLSFYVIDQHKAHTFELEAEYYMVFKMIHKKKKSEKCWVHPLYCETPK